jgi:hypothetical protein
MTIYSVLSIKILLILHTKKTCKQAMHGGTCLQSQHSESDGRRIEVFKASLNYIDLISKKPRAGCS